MSQCSQRKRSPRTRRLQHPEARIAEVQAKAAARTAATAPVTRGSYLAYGWLIILMEGTGRDSIRHFIDTPSDMGYANACALRDRQLASDDRYVGAWLIQKTFAPEILSQEEAARRLGERRSMQPGWTEDPYDDL